MFDDKPPELFASRLENLAGIVIFVIAVLVAAWLRFDQLGIKPFHHDEGVNSYFLLKLADYGDYKYDPANYHGPTLYYFALLALLIFGKSDFALRFAPALFGLLTVLMVWPLRRWLGVVGTAVAAFALALSPGLVYFSRDFIHEMLFGCFALGIVVGAWRYAESRKFIWLALAAVSAGLFTATKETALITFGVLLIAIICASVWAITYRLIREHRFSPASLVKELKNDLRGALLREDVHGILPLLDHLFAALIIFVFINIFLYSSSFFNWQGVPDAFKSILLWSERRGSEHVKSFWYYFGILFKLELPLLVGSLLAGVFVVWRGTRFWLFVAAWTLGTTLAYSIIGYKTPWLMISFLIPMALLSGYAAEQVYRALPLLSLRLLWLAVLIVALVVCGRLTWRVNFDRHDDNSNESGYFVDWGRKRQLKPYVDGQYGYVYAQTDRGLLGLVELINAETAKLPSGKHTGIHVAAPEYWPLPWYLRDYDQVAYAGSLPTAFGESPRIAQPLLVANATQQAEIDGLPGWRLAGPAYALRPGVELVLYVRDETPAQ